MSYQKFFNYQFLSKNDNENYFVNQTNQKAYDITVLEEFNQNIFLLRHFLNFIIFFIGVIYFYKLINENFSNKLALLGTSILITTPRIFSHSFYNSKDILFLSLIIIAVFYCIKLLKKNNIKNLIIASLFCALATNIKKLQ